MIEVVDVSHHYGVRPILRHVNLTVGRGEIVALMGPNGMGKTTLLAVVAGALWPLNGYVQIDGKRRRGSPEEELAIRRQVVYLPADPWMPRVQTAREWLLAIGRLYSIHDDRLMEHIPRLLELFDLTPQTDQAVSSCSTGQRKKLALAGALVSEAPVMLLDEPFAGGMDPSGILALKRLFLHHRGLRDRTILMATPVPELVEEVADRVAILRDGMVLACDTMEGLRRLAGCDGPLDEVYERLVSPRTAARIDRYFEGKL
ncbi:MAG TPA: ABC transporter ATP-binding protein [Tepidisphaeraceae bacterium]|jgi:ABC-type multidrug transport system ATPase subunit|nr:ABC transporter ATP-binding protein [Tepidisphaeraceae bacterium]